MTKLTPKAAQLLKALEPKKDAIHDVLKTKGWLNQSYLGNAKKGESQIQALLDAIGRKDPKPHVQTYNTVLRVWGFLRASEGNESKQPRLDEVTLSIAEHADLKAKVNQLEHLQEDFDLLVSMTTPAAMKKFETAKVERDDKRKLEVLLTASDLDVDRVIELLGAVKAPTKTTKK